MSLYRLSRSQTCLQALVTLIHLSLSASARYAMSSDAWTAHRQAKTVLASSEQMTCLSRGELITLDREQLNDDYCDCDVDGRDEFATAACSHIIINAIPFQCDSKYFSSELHTSRVNDGICDCCDGSDEWQYRADHKGFTCPDTCAIEASRYKGEALQRLQIVRNGLEAKTTSLTGSPRSRSFIQDLLEAKKQQVSEFKRLEKKVALLLQYEEEVVKIRENRVPVADEVETQDRVCDSDSESCPYEGADDDDQDTPVDGLKLLQYDDLSELLGDDFDYKAADLAQIQSHIETSDGVKISFLDYMRSREAIHARNRMAKSQEQENSFIEQLNSKYVRTKLHAMTLTILKGLGLIFSPVRALYEAVLSGLQHFDLLDENFESDDMDAIASTTVVDAHILQLFGDGLVYQVFRNLVWSSTIMWNSSFWLYGTLANSKEEKAKASEVQSLQKVLREIKEKLMTLGSEVEALLALETEDFGPDNAYLMLYGQCLEKEFEDYKYTFCALEKIRQDKHLVGKWVGWKPSAKSSEKYTKMDYAKGDMCWNRHERSTEVELICGASNEIVSVVEVETCRYSMVVQTFYACTSEDLEKAEQEYNTWLK